LNKVDILEFLSEEEIAEWNQEAKQGKAAGLSSFYSDDELESFEDLQELE